MDRTSRDLPARVDRLRRRIEDWRRRGTPKAMPPQLWEAAVSLARAHGVCPISRALRIDYGGLKRRVTDKRVGAVVKRAPARFVEFDAGSLLGRRCLEDPVTPESATVELWACDGSRLVVRLPEHDGTDVLALAASLWKSR